MTTVHEPAAARSRLGRFLSQAWRIALGLVLGFTFFAFAYMDHSFDEASDVDAVGAVIALDMLCGLIALVLYPFRHRFPVPVTVGLVLLSTPSTLAAGFAMLAVVSLATRRRVLEIIGISVLLVVAGFAGEHLVGTVVLREDDGTTWWQLGIVAVVMVGLLVLTGMYIGGRRQLTESLRRQVNSAVRERQAQIHAAKADERTRIAREMHDVLAHRLSLVALHSGALEYRNDLTPEETKQTAGVIRENSHLALGELREVLGMLRDPNTLFDDELAKPQPTAGQLRELLEESRAVGTAVHLDLAPEMQGRLDALPEATGRHLYRIVQEVLTNARRHAPGQEVRLELGGNAGDKLFLRASNSLAEVLPRGSGAGTLPSSGLGLTGLAERVRLAGGELQVEPEAGGAFVLKVWLPWGP
ncbi:sensor histidine kinase [Paeniglutamicibacter sp. MACA_103]|uniref:sensor histidine kinase n=1 Tax=Paeniglutamicibacter sp. MACA_103 TaxID=3377337 RepID=UPI003894A64C